ncbi:MAG TPA: hypothetical protein VGB30_08930 [bacterium]|jgi:hypothetical protein
MHNENDRLALLSEKLRRMLINKKAPRPGRDYAPMDFDKLSLALRRDILDAQRLETLNKESTLRRETLKDQRKRDEYGKIIAVLNDPEKLKFLPVNTAKTYRKFVRDLKTEMASWQGKSPQFKPKPKAMVEAIARLDHVIDALNGKIPMPVFDEPIHEPLARRFDDYKPHYKGDDEDDETDDSRSANHMEKAYRDTVQYIYSQARDEILRAVARPISRLRKLASDGMPSDSVRRRLDSTNLHQLIHQEYNKYITGRGRRLSDTEKGKLFKMLFSDELLNPFLDGLIEGD